MNLPTAAEINPIPFDLDGQCAERNFLGKDLAQAEELFRENSLRYQEDLMFMGPVAFRFYVQAAIAYIKSPESGGDSDMIRCFAGILDSRLKNEGPELAPLADQLTSICSYIIERHERYVTRELFHEDFLFQYETLRKAFREIGR